MGTFNTKKTIYASPALIPAIAEQICREFQNDGYDVQNDSLLSGGSDISITKGGTFAAILGTRTALKITLIPKDNAIAFEAGVGIFGQRIVPTVVMLFIGWPILLTQIWGIVTQSQLDDRAYAIAERAAAEHKSATVAAQSHASSENVFCTSCGTPMTSDARFCSSCGKELKQ